MSHRRLNDADGLSNGPVASLVSIAPYEYAAVYDYLGKNRYLQAAFCKSVARLYSDKFGMYTTKALSNIAAEDRCIGVLEWSKDIGCCWDKTLYISGAKGGHVDVLRWLVNHGCNMPGGDEAWIAATKKGHVEVLQFAYDSKFLHNIEDICRDAARNSHLHILKWVYEVEGNRYFDACTCQEAAMGGSIEIIKWLRSVGCAWDMLTCWCAIAQGHVDLLKWALDNGCPWSVNDKAYDGFTALHEASNIEVIEFLVSRGANINALDLYGRTPIHSATDDGKLEAVKTFVRLGADVNIADIDEDTPLDIAVRRHDIKIIEALRAAGARESV